MISFDDIKIYLPQYLTEESQKKLFSALEQFPDNMDNRLYETVNKNTETIFQGDGIKDMLFINLPDTNVGKADVMILSNTCDIDINNVRLLAPNIIYAPILKLHKVIAMLEENGFEKDRIIGYHKSIVEQKITQIFYLPRGGLLEDDSIAMLDKLCSCDSEFINRGSLKDIRLFTLSQYGFYLFLVKLSIHLTRVREGVDRALI